MDIETWLCQEIAVRFKVAEMATFVEGDGLLWTRIPYKDWAIEVCQYRHKAVRIYHCGVWSWWGPNFGNPNRQYCGICQTMIPADVEDFLLKAWEMYVL